jgi:SAM-dependent methyltransferase
MFAPCLVRFVLVLGCSSLFAIESTAPALAQEPAPSDPSTQESRPARSPAKRTRKRPIDDGPRIYMGRRIADVMSHLGAEWLVRDTREQEEQPDRMLDALKIQPGQTVADVGAGVGYTSVKMSKRVGPKGTVYATDVQPEMLRMLARNAKTMNITNIKPILCTPTDPKLPEGEVDLILMVDVYHECSDPEATLAGLRKALAPGGRLVLVEFRAEDPEVPIKPEHKMSLAQARKELEANGFRFKESLEFLPWQHIIIFEVAGATKPADAATPTKPAEEAKAEEPRSKTVID